MKRYNPRGNKQNRRNQITSFIREYHNSHKIAPSEEIMRKWGFPTYRSIRATHSSISSLRAEAGIGSKTLRTTKERSEEGIEIYKKRKKLKDQIHRELLKKKKYKVTVDCNLFDEEVFTCDFGLEQEDGSIILIDLVMCSNQTSFYRTMKSKIKKHNQIKEAVEWYGINLKDIFIVSLNKDFMSFNEATLKDINFINVL